MATAIILVATGEVGGHILNETLKSAYYDKVYVLGRESIRRLPDHDKMKRILIDFNHPIVDDVVLQDADAFFAIGTDDRKLFEKVDFGYDFQFAKICQGKIRSFNLVSAMGANSQISYYKYLQVKGRLEDSLRSMSLGDVRFYHLSMLIAPDRENLPLGDAIWIKIFQVISPVLVGPMSGWKGITPQNVAQAMVKNAERRTKQTVYLHDDMMNSVH